MHFIRTAFAVAIAAAAMLVLAPAASAETGGSTITSAYDASNPDNLSFTLSIGPATCEHHGDGTPNPWYSQLTITNLSSETPLGVSIYEGRGGVLEPGQTGGPIANGSGSNASAITLRYLFEADGTSEETYEFSIPAPESGCGATTDPSAVQCFLNNYTPREGINQDGTYNVGQQINLYAHVDDADSRVESIVFQKSLNGGEWETIQSGQNPELKLIFSQPGTWTVRALLLDTAGTAITPTGDCDVTLTLVGQAIGNPPTVPPDTTPTTSVNVLPGGNLQNSPAEAVASAELPRTGVNTWLLAAVGITLIMLGHSMVKLSKRKQKPVVDPTWSAAMRTLGGK